MKKYVVLFLSLALVVALSAPLMAGGQNDKAKGIDDPGGFPLYVIREVEWDVSDAGNSASWTVWGPKWDPEIDGGVILSECDDCLDLSKDFTFKGKHTVHFTIPYVAAVEATPQERRAVGKDFDGDGTYTGSISAWHYFSWREEKGPGQDQYMDKIEYWLTFNDDNELTHYRHLAYQHTKVKEDPTD